VRIAVLRGPQSGVYGADAVAGVINIITRGGEGDPKVRASALYGSNDTFEASAGFDGSTGRLGYLVSASYFDTEGISIASRPPGNVENDGYENFTLTTRFDFAATDTLDLTFLGRYIDARNETDSGFLPANNTEGLPAFLFQDSDGCNESEQLFGALKASWRTLDGKLVHDAQLSYVDLDSFSEAPSRQSQSTGTTLDALYNATYYLTNGTFVQVGGDYKRETALFEQPQGFLFAGIDESLWNWGVFANATVEVIDGVFLSGALRQDDNELFDGQTTFRLTAAVNLPDNFDLSGVDTKIRSSYGTGREAPGLRQLRGESATFRGNPEVQPETTWMWDIGIEQRLESGLAQWSITYYLGEANDGIFNVFDPMAGLSSPNNIESLVRMEGIEVEFGIQPVDWFDIQGAYTYATSTIVDTDTQLFGRPNHELRAAATVLPIDDGAVTVAMYARSKFFSDCPSTFELPGYELFNATIAYDVTENVRLTGNIQNIFDKEYEEKLGDGTFGRTVQLRVNVVF